jgi:hypothetical protein
MQTSNMREETNREIVHLDFRDIDIQLAHEKLGEAVQAQVYKILNEKINLDDDQGFISDIRKARLMARAIDQKIKSPDLMREIKKALIAYKAALQAWTTGARLDGYQHDLLNGLMIDGLPVRGQELAMLLQAEQLGCQTGIIRDEDHSIWLWHAEEDVEPVPGARFDYTRIFSFCYEGKHIHAFIYPDLLPGPTFGWRDDGYVQAVDTLYVKVDSSEDSIPPNIATWLTLCLGGQVPITEIVDSLSPFQKGYALLSVSQSSDKIIGEKVEFISSAMEYRALSEKYGDYLFQVNMIAERDTLFQQKYEQIDETTEAALGQRIDRTQKALEEFIPTQNKIGFLHRLLSSRDGGEYAYANQDVKAYFLCRMADTGLQKWIGVGVANADNDLVPWK